MSGGGGGGNGGGGGGGGNGWVDCASLSATTVLNSPNPEVIRTLAVGDVLDVRVPDPEQRRLVAVTSDGREAGSVTSANQAKFVHCIGEGFRYVARVVSIDGGAVQIEVRVKAGD